MNFVEKLEGEFSGLTGLKNSVAFSFGRNGLYALLKVLKIGGGDEVILPAFVCSSIPETIKSAGATPVLVDVDDTFNIDPNGVEERLSDKTRAVIVIHTYGNPAEIGKIKRICKSNDMILIEDCAHSIGSKYKNNMVGTFGDYALFSLSKEMVNFCGGIISSNLPLDHLRKKREELDSIGLSYFLKSSYYYPFRLISSFWDARGSQISKFTIDTIDQILSATNYNVKDSGVLKRFGMPSAAAWLAIRQLKDIQKDLRKRKLMGNKIRGYFEKSGYRIQKVLPNSDPVFSYFSFIKDSKNENSMFWRAWPEYKSGYEFANRLSEKLSILPISPHYREDIVKRIENSFE